MRVNVCPTLRQRYVAYAVAMLAITFTKLGAAFTISDSVCLAIWFIASENEKKRFSRTMYSVNVNVHKKREGDLVGWLSWLASLASVSDSLPKDGGRWHRRRVAAQEKTQRRIVYRR